MSTNSPHAPVQATVATESQWWINFKYVLTPLASLKLTVVLFAMSIVIVLAGTLAQVRADIWQVIHDYFRLEMRFSNSFPWITSTTFGNPFVWIDAQLFFPPAFFPSDPVFPAGFGWLKPIWPHGQPQFPDSAGFWFPKGWIIGAVMLLNLVAAHLVRFKVQATGRRLWTGWGVIALGCFITWIVIQGGSNPDGLQGEALISNSMLWNVVRMTLLALCGASIYATVALETEPAQRWMWGTMALLLGVASLFTASLNPDDAAMRILYQLTKATLAGLVLLVGCIMVFKQRAGIVLLHGGIALLMAYEVLVGVAHVESQMFIVEGDTATSSSDMRHSELAVVDNSDAEEDIVTVVPGDLLQTSQKISHALLPVDLEVLRWLANSEIVPTIKVTAQMRKENPATAGIGKDLLVQAVKPSVGTDTESKFDTPSAYVRLTDKQNQRDLGVYLLSTQLNEGIEKIQTSAGEFTIALRFKSIPKSYSVTLKDIQKNDYMGTSTPRDYSSFVTIRDKNGSSFDQRIWMNNPLRYAGDTLYQSEYIAAGDVGRNGKEATLLQVVSNEGWMAPYVSCMIVLVGMLAQFGLTLLRYLGRRARLQTTQDYAQTLQSAAAPPADNSHTSESAESPLIGWMLTALVLSIPVLWSTIALMPRSTTPDQFNYAEFGKLPMWYKGRAMPIDSFARNAMLQMADRETYWNGEIPADTKKIKRQPAIAWLLMVMSDKEKARSEHVIRIENLEVLKALGLKKRFGDCFSINEIQGPLESPQSQSEHDSAESAAGAPPQPPVQERWQKLVELAQTASEVLPENRNLFQRKALETANKVMFYLGLENAFALPPRMPPRERDVPEDGLHGLAVRAEMYFRLVQAIRSDLDESKTPPLVVPTQIGRKEETGIKDLDTQWETPVIAGVFDQFYTEFRKETPPAINLFCRMLDAARDGQATEFNAELAKYRALLDASATPADVDLAKTDFEDKYNRFNGFFMASWLYVIAGCLAALGWLFYPRSFQRASFALLLAVLLIHTLALGGRLYISGRPPVTNLYSASVFIGWAAVIGALVVERMTRLGMGNVVAAIAGFLTLRVADGLAADGDTFVVLEAVLDTQFWLATHVVTITLGYATTYLAGLLGAMYVLGGVFSPAFRPQVAKDVTRMTYGVLCFATFFSFVGTVLGGLWADDSWGRFWGWDPKENGALIIVLWNALVLHARWGAMIKERGLALLAIFGNIVVTWSFFGVNELGVGLHSYGFTEGRLMYMALFCVSQILIIGIGCLPKSQWACERARSRVLSDS